MKNKIEFSFIINEFSLSPGFTMAVTSIDQEYLFDTYYWTLGKNIDNHELYIILFGYLERCKTSILRQHLNEIIYLPVDFSDQYYGVFKVTYFNESVYKFEYGSVLKTASVFYDSDNEFVNLIIGEERFNVDFELLLTKSDVIKCFGTLNKI